MSTDTEFKAAALAEEIYDSLGRGSLSDTKVIEGGLERAFEAGAIAEIERRRRCEQMAYDIREKVEARVARLPGNYFKGEV